VREQVAVKRVREAAFNNIVTHGINFFAVVSYGTAGYAFYGQLASEKHQGAEGRQGSRGIGVSDGSPRVS